MGKTTKAMKTMCKTTKAMKTMCKTTKAMKPQITVLILCIIWSAEQLKGKICISVYNFFQKPAFVVYNIYLTIAGFIRYLESLENFSYPNSTP